MTKRLKKVTICTMMALLVLLASTATTSIKAHAASPYWGAEYVSAGSDGATFYVNASNISKVTAKAWDFSSSGTFMATVYSPSGKDLGTVLVSTNEEQPGVLTSCSENGKYKVVFSVLSGKSGGWVGAWLY